VDASGGQPSPVRNRACTELEVDKWAISDFVLERLLPVVGTRPFPLDELVLMVAGICRLEPPELYEWGTHHGASARVFAEAAAFFSLPTRIHSVDLPDDVGHVEHPGPSRARLVRELEGVELHIGDGLDVALRLWREGGRPARPLFFLDGDHAFESVARELEGIAGEVEDASMLVHDTFYQSHAAGYNVGPALAVRRIVETYPGRWRVLEAGPGLPGMTLLWRPNSPLSL
jgi:hypothetical protein